MIGGVRMDYFNYPLDTKILYRKKNKNTAGASGTD